jgi:small subunit ribosomal protein S1
VTKVVTFGAFVEILDGVEGLVHISELAQHHVENPREIIQPGDPVRVKILEIDSERRRLSLSIKRVEGQVLPVRPIEPPADGSAGSLDDVPELGLSEDVFSVSEAGTPEAEAITDTEAETEAPAVTEASVDTGEAPAETAEESPAETAEESPAEPTAEAVPAETAEESPAEPAAEAPAETAAEAPADAEPESPDAPAA